MNHRHQSSLSDAQHPTLKLAPVDGRRRIQRPATTDRAILQLQHIFILIAGPYNHSNQTTSFLILRDAEMSVDISYRAMVYWRHPHHSPNNGPVAL